MKVNISNFKFPALHISTVHGPFGFFIFVRNTSVFCYTGSSLYRTEIFRFMQSGIKGLTVVDHRRPSRGKKYGLMTFSHGWYVHGLQLSFPALFGCYRAEYLLTGLVDINSLNVKTPPPPLFFFLSVHVFSSQFFTFSRLPPLSLTPTTLSYIFNILSISMRVA